MNDRRRIGAGCMLVAFSQGMRFSHSPWVFIIGTLMVLVGFLILFPVLKRQCNNERSRIVTLWVLSVLGVLVVLANAVMEISRLFRQ